MPTRASPERGAASAADVGAIVAGADDDPFRILGLDEIVQGWIARTP
jgi:hypothetical protein